jgi:hypothetical protein
MEKGAEYAGFTPQIKQFFVSLLGGPPMTSVPNVRRPAKLTDLKQFELSVPKLGEPKAKASLCKGGRISFGSPQ